MPIINHNHEWYVDSYKDLSESDIDNIKDDQPDTYRTKKMSYAEVLRCLDEDCSAARKRENDKMGAVYDYDL